MPLSNIQLSPELRGLDIAKQARPAPPGFAEQFKSMLAEVNTQMKSAEKASDAFAAGENNNIHETILAAEKASIALKLVGTIRNKVLEAYQEVMRSSM
ncbi:MAG: flagellar hook-basal body complex protein FliE [Deltaproteobacteria bacterium]|nr:flagellar hook-basal body complex protein FliE [Deltaproteobacteria bacterium]